MARVSRLILIVCALSALVLPRGVGAQTLGESPVTRLSGTTVNLFETLDPSSPISGVRLQLPAAWQVQDVRVLRYGTEPVSVQRRAGPGGDILLTTESPIRGAHELILRVRTGEEPGMYAWHLTPFVQATGAEVSDSLTQRRFLFASRRTRRVKVEPPARPEGPNRAVDLSGAARPLLLQGPDRPPIGPTTSFTIEFWMRTAGLDQVVLSTWTGNEAAAYPAEFVVDPGGRLRFYCGQSGQHQALRTQTPVADNRWHHAAVVYDETESRLHLMLDGTVVDSAQARALPSTPSTPPLAIGGRRSRQVGNGADASYTGRLDQLLIWPRARSVAALRRTRGRPAPASGAEGNGPLHLGFDQDAETTPVEWSAGARRVSTTLSFRSVLRNLRAHTEGKTVTLRWQVAAESDRTFVVERSLDGASFSPVARLRPSDAVTSRSKSRKFVYTDEDVPGQIVYYRIRQASAGASRSRTTRTVKIGLGTQSQRPVKLMGNFPNPFKASTTITYRVEERQSLTLTVWDLSGKRIATLSSGTHDPGRYERTLDASDLPSGPYFARLETARGVQTHRMMHLK